MPELKPCPFCGQTPKMEESARFQHYGKDEGKRIKGYTVVCQNMYCILHNEDNWYRRSAKEASEEWNHRAEPENRLLTLGEAQQISSEDGGTWLEEKKAWGLAHINPIDNQTGACYIYTFFAKFPLMAEKYGKTWRCWLRKPSPEQMAAEKWEE